MVPRLIRIFRSQYTIWVNLVRKIKIVSLSWNLVLILLWIYRIRAMCTSLFYTKRNQFWSNSVQKITNVSLSWNFIPRVFSIDRIQERSSLFCFQPEIILLDKFAPKIKTISLSRNLVLRVSDMKEGFKRNIHFFYFRPEVSFSGANLVVKSKIIC